MGLPQASQGRLPAGTRTGPWAGALPAFGHIQAQLQMPRACLGLLLLSVLRFLSLLWAGDGCPAETGVLPRRVSCRSRRVRVPAALQPQAGAGLSPGRVGGRALARVSSAVRLSESSCWFCHVPSLTCSPHCGSFTRSEAQAQCAAPHALHPPPRRRVWPPVAPVAVHTQVPCPRHASRE